MENFCSVKYAGAKPSAGLFYFLLERVLFSVGRCWFQSCRGSLVPNHRFLFGTDTITQLQAGYGEKEINERWGKEQRCVLPYQRGNSLIPPLLIKHWRRATLGRASKHSKHTICLLAYNKQIVPACVDRFLAAQVRLENEGSLHKL